VRSTLGSANPDLVEEVAQHITDRWMRACNQGIDPAVADAQAEADLESWRGRPVPSRTPPWRTALPWLGWRADVRFAVRALRVRPMFAVGAALLSLVAVTAIVCGFAIVYGILWRPLPYPAAHRLAVVWQERGGERSQISYPDFVDVAAAGVFDGAAAMSGGRGSLRLGDAIRRINMLSIEAPGFAMLGATPRVGRLLSASDADQPVIMISYRLWTTHLGSDPAVVGRRLWISGADYTVVGVLQPGFDFELPVPPSFVLEDNDVWTVFDRSTPFLTRRDVTSYEGLVRLAPGRSLDEAQAAADATAARLVEAHRTTNSGRTFRIAPLKAEVVEPVRRPLVSVAIAAAATLVVALANLAILGLVRGCERQTELSIREALGAGSFRLRRQLFTENALIAACGALCGVALAHRIVHGLLLSDAANLPRADAVRFDAPVLWMAGATAFLLAVVLTAQPLHVRSSTLRTGARTAGTSVRRSRRVMVATEIALALVLAAGGGLLALSFVRLLAVDPGFDPSGGAAARVSAYAARYPSKDQVVRLFDDVLGRLREMPDVAAAGAGSSLPLSGQSSGTSIVAEGRPVPAASRPTAGWQFVTPGYFDAAGMRFRSGRDFSEADRDRARHLTIINEDLARSLFPGEDPIGQRIGVGGGDAGGDWHEIVGVVDDVRHQALDQSASPRVYDLFGQHWGRTLFVVARSRTTDGTPLISAIRQTVARFDADAPVFESATLQTLVDRSAAARRLASAIAGGLACAGVLLALIGVYAVAAASVAERAREIGVRAALGARPRDLFRLIAAESGVTAAWGGAAGLAASFVVVRLVRSQLFGVHGADAMWLIPLVAAGVLGAALLAAVPPGRKAASADPLSVMKAE
jgi:predicted permease